MRLHQLALLALAAPAAIAGDVALNQGFAVSNRSPVVDGFGVPVHRADQLPGPGAWSGAVRFEVANSYSVIDAGNESSVIDGETAALTVGLLRGLKSGWAVGIEVPVVRQSGGFLDGVIDYWHDTFGLDAFSRSRPEDELLYRYTRGGATLFSFSDEGASLGDVTLLLGVPLGASETGAATAWFELKLPTGDAARFSGSGAADIAARLQGHRAAGRYGTLFGGLGIARLGEGELLPGLQNDVVGSVTAGYSWQRWSRVALKLQIDAQSAAYDDTGLRQFGDAAVQLTVGGSVRTGERSILDLAFVEDEWKGQVSPDFGFLLRWRTY